MKIWASLLSICFINGPWNRPAQAADADIASETQFILGEKVYAQNCATCHYDGKGNAAAPDLIGTSFWKGGPERLITMILKGQSGVSVVDGKVFRGEMPAMAYLTDEEIAAVTVYVFAKFGEQRVVVESVSAAKLRAGD